MKKTSCIIHILLVLVLMRTAPGDAEPIYAKVGTALNPNHPTLKALEYFKANAEKNLEGQINIQIFPDSFLGSAQEILEGLQFGSIELGVLSSELLASYSPFLSAISMPYLFRDENHCFRVLDGPIGANLLCSLEENNLIGLGFFETGIKNLVTKQKPIQSPGDLQGLKIGVINNYSGLDYQNVVLQVLMDSLSMMGGVVKLINPDEIYEALQPGTLDGWQSSEAESLLSQVYETGAVYFTYSRYATIPDVFVASKRWFTSLDPEIQKTIQEAARLTAWKQRRLWAEYLQETTTKLGVSGMKFEVAERELFFNAVLPIYSEMYAKFGSEFEEIIQAIIAVK